ncbi:uncharacterized protein LOC114325839 [Diabrotica virgifera virgifera]|uniref:Uncharacterized protein LOC114325839 n=1 Tax=Diabrotica virgifera virgifera TaxID=50390 RepID=A0A6P7F4G5_DIAVI|nr:uncharacterized protein LOC114325839 [Diabrotica virgifera virgifera]
MRDSMCSNKLLLYFLIGAFTISIFRGTKMAIEGLPLHRQEPDGDQDILAGADFLSVFMESSLRRAYAETTSTVSPTTIIVELEEVDYTTKREKRNSNAIDLRRDNSPTSYSSSLYTNTLPFSQSTEQVSDSDSSTNKDGVVVAVSVSSSVAKAVNSLYRRSTLLPIHKYFSSDRYSNLAIDNRRSRNNVYTIPTTTPPEPDTYAPQQLYSQVYTTSTTAKPFQNYFDIEQKPGIIAKASKSDLSVEESQPITKDSEIASDFSGSYPARVRIAPPFDQSAFLNQNIQQTDNQSYNPTFIYHDNPQDSDTARSISYSSIVQSLPQLTMEAEKTEPHERRERNYNDAKSPYINNLNIGVDKRKQNDSKILNWQDSESDQRNTEKPWSDQQKYTPTTPLPVELPKVYGQPEQNYEVDEALSVVTNGRAHGVQTTKSDKKPDDNQKFGYVVEGKNYRKYRVEERTADGFIVGEYGVVSHDDGSLRGVRYTADGTINPRLISEALMKFLSL